MVKSASFLIKTAAKWDKLLRAGLLGENSIKKIEQFVTSGSPYMIHPFSNSFAKDVKAVRALTSPKDPALSLKSHNLAVGQNVAEMRKSFVRGQTDKFDPLNLAYSKLHKGEAERVFSTIGKEPWTDQGADTFVDKYLSPFIGRAILEPFRIGGALFRNVVGIPLNSLQKIRAAIPDKGIPFNPNAVRDGKQKLTGISKFIGPGFYHSGLGITHGVDGGILAHELGHRASMLMPVEKRMPRELGMYRNIAKRYPELMSRLNRGDLPDAIQEIAAQQTAGNPLVGGNRLSRWLHSKAMNNLNRTYEALPVQSQWQQMLLDRAKQYGGADEVTLKHLFNNYGSAFSSNL